MLINYSKYTLEELLDVNENIDKEQYPERYKQLCDEIQRRKELGEFEQFNQELEEHKYDNMAEKEFIIDFSENGNGNERKRFISMFIFINIAFLVFITPQYVISDLAYSKQYATEVDSIECLKDEAIDEDTGQSNTYYDLNILSYDDTFMALDIGEKSCKELEKKLPIGTKVKLWHEGEVIHQLASQERILLPYNYSQAKTRFFNENGFPPLLLLLLMTWLFFFKSLVNAIAPGTFIVKSN